MTAHRVRLLTGLLLALSLPFGPCADAEADSNPRNWALSLYYARLNNGSLGETFLFDVDLEDSALVVLALSRRFYSYRDWFDLEFEGQVGKHFQEQDHWEFNILGTFRWVKFPWDRYVDTSLAAGAGLSYATEEPEIEFKNHGKVSQLLGFLMFEAAFALPRIPQWEIFTRIHHRSGAGGIFNDVKGGSNAYAAGLRFKF